MLNNKLIGNISTETRKAPRPFDVFCNSVGKVWITVKSGSLQNFCSKGVTEDLSVFITISNILPKLNKCTSGLILFAVENFLY